jgi:hypothetical protein
MINTGLLINRITRYRVKEIIFGISSNLRRAFGWMIQIIIIIIIVSVMVILIVMIHPVCLFKVKVFGGWGWIILYHIRTPFFT